MALRNGTTDPLAGFKQLSSTISLYTPDHATQPKSNEPTLVILCTWAGGATLQRISKYTSIYRSLLPNTTILLVQAHPLKTAFMPFPIPLSPFVYPAITAIKAHLATFTTTTSPSPNSPNQQPRILFHIFSHAGSTSALAIIGSLRSRGIEPAPLIKGVIFDSCPADMDFSASWSALSVSLPSSLPLRLAAHFVIVPALASAAVLQEFGVLRQPDSVSKALLKEETFGACRRLYLLGKRDGVIDWREGWRCALDARRVFGEGKVEVCLFERGEHCALVLGGDGEEKRYWKAVKGLWEEGGERESKL